MISLLKNTNSTTEFHSSLDKNLSANATLVDNSHKHEKMNSSQTIIFSTVTAFACIIIIVGNTMVLVAVKIEKSLRNYSSSFIISLAWTDLLIGLPILPLWSQYTIQNEWLLGAVIGDLYVWVDFTVCLTSRLTVVLIGADRLFAVKYPLFYRKWMSTRKSLFIIILSWIIPAGIYGYLIVIWQNIIHNKKALVDGQCHATFLQNKVANLAHAIFTFWIPLVLLIIMYACIFKIASKFEVEAGRKSNSNSNTASRNKNLNHGSDTSIPSRGKSTPRRRSSRFHAPRKTKMFSMILATFTICWTPFFTCQLIELFMDDFQHKYGTLYLVFSWLAYLNSFFDPFVYARANPHFRKAFVRILWLNFKTS